MCRKLYSFGEGCESMFEYRVTKYDPAFRNPKGAYLRDEWISVSDIGNSFGGVVFTEEEYQRVEDAYVAVGLAFLREASVTSLTVIGLENHAGVAQDFVEDIPLMLENLGDAIRGMLRGQFWCRLEDPKAFIHIGYDYYMYVGVETRCPLAEHLARKLKLFVEPFFSPYHLED